MKAFRYVLSPHDFLFYVARELVEGVPTDIISNTALLYAFNTHARVHRNASGTVPHYEEDAERFTLYPTPAALSERALSEGRVVLGNALVRWGGVSTELVRMTYNSVQTTTQTTDVGHLCFPMVGHYMKYQPLTPFEGFVLGGVSSRLLRLGKKLSPVRVYYERLEDATIREGTFTPSHPVNANDLPSTTRLVRGRLQVIPPTPIYTQCVLDGQYIEGRCDGKPYRIALPDLEKYSGVHLE